MSFSHQAAEFLHVAAEQCLRGGYGAQVFADHVASAHERLGRHLVAPFFQILERGVAQEGNIWPVTGNDGAGGLGLAPAGWVVATGDGVLDHGVGDN